MSDKRRKKRAKTPSSPRRVRKTTRPSAKKVKTRIKTNRVVVAGVRLTRKRLAQLEARGIKINARGQARRGKKPLSKRALERATLSVLSPEEKAERRLTPAARRAIKGLTARQRAAVLADVAAEQEERRRQRAEKRAERLEAERTKEQTRALRLAKTAETELRDAVRAASENGSRLYGEYNPITRHRHDIRGTFSGFKKIPFDRRAQYVQERLRDQNPRSYRRDLYVQSVHVREYLSQIDDGSGRRSIIEKTQRAGRRALAEIGRLRVHQIAIGMIRVLVRKQDAGKYGGYSTRPIGKKIKAALDIRGLEGFEKVSAGEDPRAALDRILDRLDDHLIDILDGLPVVYVKSLQVKFDVEEQE